MIDDGSNGTMYLKKRQWFFRKLLHLLRKRRWCRRNFQLMRALSILLLLGGDVELNPGPHQIVLIRRYNSLSKLSTTDEKHLSGLGIPDLHMDCVCHVAVNLSGLSVPDYNMDCVCHVTMKLSGLSVPDCNMDCVCHVIMKLSGSSVPDCNMDYVCHVATGLSGLSIPDVHMEYGCHMHKMELDIGCVPICQEPCCKRDIQLAYMYSLVLLLGGDVELNPGPRQNVVNDTSETARECDSDKQSTSSDNGVDSRLVMLSVCQRKRLQNETSAERTSRLARLIENQRQRLENESEEQRSARLGRLTDNQARRLQNESEEQRSARLGRLTDNQARRLQNESEEQRSARLGRLTDNQARRLENESMVERAERLTQLSHNRRKRKQNETSEERAIRVSRIAARKQARMSSLSEEERILRQQQQREQTRLRVQALRRKRQQIVELQSSVEPNVVNAENSEGDPSVHLQTPQLVVVAPPNQGTKISGNFVKFRKAILEASSNKCFSCKKLHYDRLGGTIAWDEAGKMLEVVNLSVDDSVGQLWFCNKCKKSLQQKKVPAASHFNNMKVAKVPSALRELNTLEERLIAKATVFMKMVILPRGGQRAVRGQVINFPSDVDGIVSHLPRPPSGEDIVYVQRPDSTTEMESQSVEHGARYLRCRYSRVMEALGWLKRNNPLYEDVIINGVTEDMFDDEDDGNGGSEGEDAHAHSEELQESGVVRLDVLHPNIPAVELLQEENAVHRQVHQLQRVTATPLSIFQDRHNLEVQAFPTLYPDGRNGFGTPRAIKISPLEYFQVRMLSADSRWACHPAYIFWACNIVEAIKLQSSISIALRMRSFRDPSSNRREDRRTEEMHLLTTAGQLRGRLDDNPHLRENCYSFMRYIRGTQAYWNSVKIQLYAMFRTLGPPTFFITLSADDNNWTDLMVVLSKCKGQNLSEEQASELSPSEKRALMTTNPVVTARHFAHRFQCLSREVIKGTGQPIGEVLDFFWRIEFQLRGSPHVHSMWWIKDAPNLDTATGRQVAPQYIDRYISVGIPKESDGELGALVLRLQQHHHTSTCRKTTRRRRNVAECRFDFPQPLCEETRLKSHDDPGNRSRCYLLKRSVGEENINPYNEHLLRAWQANMDIQLIGSVYGTAAYVCSYMCKGESEEVRKAIREALVSLPAHASSRQRLSKVGNTMLTHRELSAQEAAYRLCHLPLKENSRKVVFLNTSRPEKRTRLLKSRSDLLQLEDDSSDIFIPGIFDRYASRPITAEFEVMTFAHFAVWYDLDTTRGDATEPTSGRQPRAQLQNGLGWVRLRRKQACLRIPVQTVESHGDDYYYSLLLLYIPWRKEPVDILQGHGSAMEAFLARQNEMVVLNAENHSFADEVQRAVVQLQALQDDAYQDTVAPMAQQVQREDANQPTVEAEGGILNPEHTVDPSWLEGTDGEDGTVNADTLHDDDDAIGALSRQTLSERDYRQLVSSLNEHQRVPFDRVVRYTRELHQYNVKVRDDPPEAFHLFVTGGAGTGKSHVIRAIKEHLERSVSGGPNKHACMLMAPTGVAAFNIGGLTIHRALQLQVEHGRLARQISLGALALHDLRDLWKGVHTIIIDEVSMVSYQILKSIHSRLCEIYANDEIFGGLNVIAVGDFYQLSPVNGSFIFSDQRSSGRLASHLWRDFFTMVELKVNMRQQNDTSFSQMLNRIRKGDHTHKDVKAIQGRLVSNGDIDLSAAPFDTALRLYPRTASVDEYNESQIAYLAQTTKLYTFEAEHAILQSRGQFYANVQYNEVPERLIPQDDKECAALPRRLKLAVGARVMLHRNINCGDGLVNGARGKIVGFKWSGNASDQSKPGELPVEVYVRFLDPNVGRISRVPVSSGEQDVVPIRPISARFYGKEGTLLQRTQIPLILCWAATVHKVQGLSLDAAVIDLGVNVFEPGMAYVALSRVRTLGGLALLNFEPMKVKANKRVHEEMERLTSPQLRTLQSHCVDSGGSSQVEEMEVEE